MISTSKFDEGSVSFLDGISSFVCDLTGHPEKPGKLENGAVIIMGFNIK
jgi:hypothetical protein